MWSQNLLNYRERKTPTSKYANSNTVSEVRTYKCSGPDTDTERNVGSYMGKRNSIFYSNYANIYCLNTFSTHSWQFTCEIKFNKEKHKYKLLRSKISFEICHLWLISYKQFKHKCYIWSTLYHLLCTQQSIKVNVSLKLNIIIIAEKHWN